MKIEQDRDRDQDGNRDQNRDYFFLKQFLDSPGQILKRFAGTKTNPKGLDLDAAAKRAVEAQLLARNFIAVNGKGKDRHFAITDAGRAHFANLPVFPPPPPPPDPKLKVFILLNLLGAGDRPVTLKQVKAMLPPAVAKTLGASKESLSALLESLVKDGALLKSSGEGTSPDDRVVFRVTENGKQEILHHRQHGDMVFKLSGSAVNQLLELAAGKPIANATVSHCMPLPAGDQAQNLVALAAASSFSDEELIGEARALMATRGSNGLLPIYELRRHIRKKFGEHAAGLDEFDRKLKRLRGERLDLISLFDRSSFSHDQISEGVQGVGELFFYVRNLR
ncbi:MAG TPA: hypothetical protein VFE47_28025 [Tepidisphaeraceae bacterium]|nr:hypothetical protein [Tepidisphaeraceae bacterium]